MPDIKVFALKYLKIFILGALVIFIIDFIINGNLLQGGRFPEYLAADVLPLFFLCSIGGVYEYTAMKRFNQKFNVTVYFVSLAFSSVLYSAIFNNVELFTSITYKPYTHAGIIIFTFAAGIFYYFNKKEEITTTEYGRLNADEVENKTLTTINPFMMRAIEIMLGISAGLFMPLYGFAYSFLMSM